VVFVVTVVAIKKVMVAGLAKSLSIAQRGRREQCKGILTCKVAVVNSHCGIAFIG
jgi:hypothetical protein